VNRRVLIAFIAVLVLAHAPGSAAQTAAGAGARPCSAFTLAAREDATVALDSYVAWAQGFISGFNWANARRLDIRVDAPGLLAWLGDYCAANPGHRLYTAVQALIEFEAR